MFLYNRLAPPFIADRELFLFGQGVDRVDENGTIVISVKSYDIDEYLTSYYGVQVPKAEKSVRVDIPFAIVCLKPLAPKNLETDR